MPEDRGLVPQLTVEENILLPLWVAGHLDRKARLEFVYEVIGELAEMRFERSSLGAKAQKRYFASFRLLTHTQCFAVDPTLPKPSRPSVLGPAEADESPLAVRAEAESPGALLAPGLDH